MAFVPLRQDAVSKILELRNDPSETKQWVGEVQMTIDGKKEVRYLLLTECCVYIFTKSKLRLIFEVTNVESVFNLVEVTTDHDELTLKFKGDVVYNFTFPESATFRTNLLTVYRYLLYQVNVNTLPGVQNIAAADKIEPPAKRPAHILLHRYIASCIARKAEIEKPIVELFSSYDEKPTKTFTFGKINITSPAPAFFALSMEGYIRYVVFDNFSPDNLGQFAVWILTNANLYISVTFKNYTTANFHGLTNRRNAHNHVNTLNLYKCDSKFIQDFIQALKPATYSIETLIMKHISLSESLQKSFINALGNYAFFSNLTALAFNDCKCVPSFIDLALKIIRTKQTLTSLTMEACAIDVCEMIIEMSRAQSAIQNISLRRNFGKVVMEADEAVSQSILAIDVGACEWSADALAAFFTAMCRWTRKMPLALSIDACRPSRLWPQVLGMFPMESFRPVITELNVSHNVFDNRTFERFLRFLETQSPLLSVNQTKLMHLALSGCFKDEDVEPCLTQLTDFFNIRELWGLELCDICDEPKAEILTQFINKLKDIQRLTSLNLAGNFLNNTAARALVSFVQESLTIAEVSMDHSSIKESDQLIWLYDSLMSSSHVLAFNRPIEDLAPIAHFNEAKRINGRLAMKRKLSNTSQRLALFLSLSGDFATRVPRPIEMEPDNSSTEAVSTSELLFEQNFVDPVPSLFTLASLNNVDMNVDPLASMVTEYIVTSGKYGIVPPTAPPPEPPKDQFALPVIFATMQLEDEIDPDEDENMFDPTEADLSEISSRLGAKLREDMPTLSVLKPAPKWTDRKEMMTIPLIEFAENE